MGSPEAAAGPARLPDMALWALMVAATLLAYLPALHGAALWDDNMHITRADLRPLTGLWRIWFELGATQQYYPLLHSAFWVEHRLWGDSVAGYHALNVVLHGTSAFLVAIILRRLSVAGWWLAGFIFALHPVCVEAVAWISEQKSTLSGVFYLAAALVYLDFDRTRRWPRYWLAFGLFALALMSKTVTATLAAALLLVLWWQRGSLSIRRDALPMVPWLAAGTAAGLFTAWVERTPGLIGAQGPQYAMTVGQRLLLAGRAPWFYAGKALLPVNLMFTYPRWKLDTSDAVQYCFPALLLVVAGGLIWWARRNRGPLAAFLFFVGTLFPALGFLNVYPFRYSYVADHFQYIALLGVIVPAAAGLTIAIRKMAQGHPAFRAVPFMVMALLGVGTSLQSANYRDYETLFRATLERNPDSAFAHSNLGVILMSSGRESEAATQFAEAVRLSPDDPDYHVNLGLALAQVPNRIPDAIREYQAALRLAPHLAAAHLNLGLAYTSMPGRLHDAIEEYQQAIAEYRTKAQGEPDLWEAHFNLGLAYGQIPGKESDAVGEYRKALALKPDSALAHFHLGNALHKLNRIEEAIAEYQVSAGIDPEVPEVHYELAYALAQVPGKVPDAILECRKMLALKPGDGPGQQLLSALLAMRDR